MHVIVNLTTLFLFCVYDSFLFDLFVEKGVAIFLCVFFFLCVVFFWGGAWSSYNTVLPVLDHGLYIGSACVCGQVSTTYARPVPGRL